MRKAIGIASFVALVGSVLFVPVALAAPADDKPEYRVYVFTRGAPTSLSTAAVKAVKDLGKANGFTVQSNGDPTQFTEENLARFRAVILLADSDNVLNADQQAAFEAYYTDGGGVLAIHSAIETEPDWGFLTEVLGARSSGRTDQPGGHDQGRGPRPRGVRASCPSTGTERSPVVQLRRQRPRLQPRARNGHRGPVRRPPAGPGHRDHGWHDGLRPPDRVVQGLPAAAARSTPVSAARRRRSRTR